MQNGSLPKYNAIAFSAQSQEILRVFLQTLFAIAEHIGRVVTRRRFLSVKALRSLLPLLIQPLKIYNYLHFCFATSSILFLQQTI